MLADTARQNLHALLMGAIPAYYVPGAFDGGVQGIVLSLQLPGKADRTDCSRFNILGELPLQSSLFEMTKAAADLLQQNGLPPTAIAGAAIGLTVLWDAAMHGAPDVAAVARRGSSSAGRFRGAAKQLALAWNPQAGPEVLREAVDLLRSPTLPGDRCSVWRSFRPATGSRWPA